MEAWRRRKRFIKIVTVKADQRSYLYPKGLFHCKYSRFRFVMKGRLLKLVRGSCRPKKDCFLKING